MLGPLLFAVYVSEIDAVIQSHSVQYHQYADDLMIYLSLVPKAFGDLSSLVGCSDAVSTWFLPKYLLTFECVSFDIAPNILNNILLMVFLHSVLS